MSSLSGREPGARSGSALTRWLYERPAFPAGLSPFRSVPGLIAALGGLYALLFLIHLHQVLTVTWQNSDVAIVAVVAHGLDTGAPLGSVVIGNRPLYEEILGLTLTGWLPLAREIWLIAPLVWDLVGLAALGWAASRALGRRAALFSVVALACLGQMGRQYFLSWDFHDLPEFHAVLLCAALVHAAGLERPLRRRRVLLGALGLGVLGAFPLASDSLFIFSGLAPLVGASLALAIVRRDRSSLQILGLTLVVVGLNVGLAQLLTHIMVAAGFIHSPITLTPTPLARLPATASLLLQGLTNIGGGDFLAIAPDGHGVLTLLRGVLILGGLAVALALCLRVLWRILRRRAHSPAEVAYTAFWAGALLLGLGAYLASGVAVDYLSGRYLLGPYVAVAALLGTLVPAPGRLGRLGAPLLAGGVGLFALSGALALPSSATGQPGLAPAPPAAQALARFARAEGVRVGYASYWAAIALSWETHFQLRLSPVVPCGSAQLCPGNLAATGWYVPRTRRSLLIVDPTVPNTGGIEPGPGSWLTVNPAKLGAPVATRVIDGMHVAVYGYDIASRMPAFSAVYPGLVPGSA